jgi:hypothetical protein
MEGKRNRQREYIGLVKYIFQLQLVRLVILSSHLHLFVSEVFHSIFVVRGMTVAFLIMHGVQQVYFVNV